MGNVYLKHFLKQPTFRLSNPVFTLEKVVELWNPSFDAWCLSGRRSTFQSPCSLLRRQRCHFSGLRSPAAKAETENHHDMAEDERRRTTTRRRTRRTRAVQMAQRCGCLEASGRRLWRGGRGSGVAGQQ